MNNGGDNIKHKELTNDRSQFEKRPAAFVEEQ